MFAEINKNVTMFKNVFSFDGRIRRTEYGITYLVYSIISGIFNFYSENNEISTLTAFLAIAAFIPMLWIMLAQGAKRCHDRGNSGWYQIIPFYVFWMIFADGEVGENQYGPNPKNIGNGSSINEIGAKEI